MRAILVYSLVNYLLKTPTVDSVFGYHAFKHLLELVFNAGHPLGVQPLSSTIYGTYTAFVYLTPVIGGFIADRWIGQRYSVIIGAHHHGHRRIHADGCRRRSSSGLLLLIIGNGFFKPNISTQVGNLYKPGDSRIDRAYSIFYVGINVGATFSPLVSGTLGDMYGYHWGYGAAGVGMIIGLFVYLFALRTLPADRVGQIKAQTTEKKPLTGDDWKAIIALLLLRHSRKPVLVGLRTAGQHDQPVRAGPDRQAPHPRPHQLADPCGLVPVVQSRDDRAVHAARHRLCGHGRRSRGKEPSVLTKMAMGNFMLAASYRHHGGGGLCQAATARSVGSGCSPSSR